MVDLVYLENLLKLLDKTDVSLFRDGALQLEFSKDGKKINHQDMGTVPIDTKDHIIEAPIDESKIPIDLRTDEIMKEDNILFYSSGGPPNTEDSSMPLTGEKEL